MRDTEKYLYVEVALPKDHQAVQRLIDDSDRRAIPLRVLIKSATILAYTDDNEQETKYSPKPAKRSKKLTKKDQGPMISDASRASANSLLDDMGFE